MLSSDLWVWLGKFTPPPRPTAQRLKGCDGRRRDPAFDDATPEPGARFQLRATPAQSDPGKARIPARAPPCPAPRSLSLSCDYSGRDWAEKGWRDMIAPSLSWTARKGAVDRACPVSGQGVRSGMVRTVREGGQVPEPSLPTRRRSAGRTPGQSFSFPATGLPQSRRPLARSGASSRARIFKSRAV